jgi:hypothetical protein
MDIVDIRDGELVGRLKRLEAAMSGARPGYGYQDLLARHESRKQRTRRRRAVARGSASALVLAMVALSVWRLEPGVETLTATEAPALESGLPQQRLVRADSYLPLAALEDHIASLDDALSDARSMSPRGAEVARLERTRAELLDSYAQVRYAEMVSNTF